MPISKTENRNCLEAMQEFPDRFFELAIVDPPYGKQPTRNTDGLGVCKKTFELGCDKWDVKPAGLYFKELLRVSTWNGMIQGNMKNKERRIHPTQKPVALYKWLLTNYAKQGDKILDTHLGSGSSRIACYDLGFDFYGYELDADYFDAQEKRFAEHIKQPKLFEPIFAKTEQVNLF
jgi:site-specific DNA-methyltransferase (adenine-specific)